MPYLSDHPSAKHIVIQYGPTRTVCVTTLALVDNHLKHIYPNIYFHRTKSNLAVVANQLAPLPNADSTISYSVLNKNVPSIGQKYWDVSNGPSFQRSLDWCYLQGQHEATRSVTKEPQWARRERGIYSPASNIPLTFISDLYNCSYKETFILIKNKTKKK